MKKVAKKRSWNKWKMQSQWEIPGCAAFLKVSYICRHLKSPSKTNVPQNLEKLSFGNPTMPPAAHSKQLKKWAPLQKWSSCLPAMKGKAVVLIYEREWLRGTDCIRAGMNPQLTHSHSHPCVSWAQVTPVEWEYRNVSGTEILVRIPHCLTSAS